VPAEFQLGPLLMKSFFQQTLWGKSECSRTKVSYEVALVESELMVPLGSSDNVKIKEEGDIGLSLMLEVAKVQFIMEYFGSLAFNSN
jgi:hypothetical protein